MRQIIFMLTGTVFIALAITVFAMPNQISDGGVPGIALLLYFQFGISPALVTFISFLVLQIISLRYLPKKYCSPQQSMSH